jgi:hypothetical protein
MIRKVENPTPGINLLKLRFVKILVNADNVYPPFHTSMIALLKGNAII